MYKFNNLGKEFDKKQIKEVKKGLIFGPIIYCITTLLLYVNMKETVWVFYVFFILSSILWIAIFVAWPIFTLRRHNKTICEISFNTSELTIKGFKSLWMKSKTLKFNIKDIKIINRKFTWYGDDIKDGFILQVSHKQEYYFVNDFFDENEEIYKKLKMM